MRKQLAIASLATLTLPIFAASDKRPATAASYNGQSNYDKPVATAWARKESFSTYSQDFARMAQAYGDNNLQYEIAMELAAISARAYERVDSAETILFLYAETSGSPQHAACKSRAVRWLTEASQVARVDIDGTQTNLTYASKAGLAVEAQRMKEDLQASLQWLEQARNSID